MATEGAVLNTSRFENDTLLFSENGLKIKFYGSWQDSVALRIAVQNKTDKNINIMFDGFIVKNGNGERARIGDITERIDGSLIHLRHSRVGNEENKDPLPRTTITAQSERMFTVVFSNLFISGKDEKTDTLYITLPIELDDKIKVVKEFKTVFKKINRKTKDMPDPVAWQ